MTSAPTEVDTRPRHPALPLGRGAGHPARPAPSTAVRRPPAHPPSLPGGPMRDAVAEPGSHEPREYQKSPRKAAASGWMGSALEYYDFFIYAQAAALVFPTIFFPESDPQIGIIASLATFGVGYVARRWEERSVGKECRSRWTTYH